MFIAMNRFRIRKGAEAEFEAMWQKRDSHLKGVPGFLAFHLLKGPEAEEHTLYASHSAWSDRAAFEAWTTSEAFRAAHKDAGGSRNLYLGPPQLELFEAKQELKAQSAA